MSVTSLNKFLPLINQQIELQETLNHQILKIKALANITLSDDFLEYPRETVQFYFLAMNDIVETSTKISENSLNSLLKSFQLDDNFNSLINNKIEMAVNK